MFLFRQYTAIRSPRGAGDSVGGMSRRARVRGCSSENEIEFVGGSTGMSPGFVPRRDLIDDLGRTSFDKSSARARSVGGNSSQIAWRVFR